jgi:hypothetical protein
VTPPTPEQEDSALAALTGTITERKPVTDLDRAMMRLRLVAEAKDRGISWTVIGNALGCSGKEAHRRMKALAAQTQRDLLAARNREAGMSPPSRGRARTLRKGATPKPRVMAAGWPDEAAGFADEITGKGTPVVVPHIDFDTPTGNPQVRARIGYGLTPLGSTRKD